MTNGVDQISIADLTENVRLLNKKRDELFKLIELNNQAILASLTALYDQKIGVKPGSIVESGGDEFRVTNVIVRVENDPKGKPWVYGNPRLRGDGGRDRHKNGGWATVVKNLQSEWELVTK